MASRGAACAGCAMMVTCRTATMGHEPATSSAETTAVMYAATSIKITDVTNATVIVAQHLAGRERQANEQTGNRKVLQHGDSRIGSRWDRTVRAIRPIEL